MQNESGVTSSKRPSEASVAIGALLLAACAQDRPRDQARSDTAATASRPAAAATANVQWTFAVMSDLHIPRDGHISPALEHAVSAVIASHPRFVVITGDFTDGELLDPKWRILEAPRWWEAVRALLAPIRAAGIPVLPIAGNHDSYLPIYRADYAAAWRDLAAWAAPLQIEGKRALPIGHAVDAAPFSYGVDIDGVHLTLAHVVDEALEPGVARWIEHDLASAKDARLRIVFGHVPLASRAATPRSEFVANFGQILAEGHADLYVSGHEHLVWDDDVDVPGRSRVQQVIVGTAAAPWRFGPNAAARERARCVYSDSAACCTMPRGRTPFELRRERDGWFEAQPRTFALFVVDGARVDVSAMVITSEGTSEPFGRPLPCAEHAEAARLHRGAGKAAR